MEFVLAPAPSAEVHTLQSEGHSAHSAIIQSHSLGEHAVWLLGFDCCKNMPLDETGVEQAAAAFYRKDFYYPRPGRDDVKDQAFGMSLGIDFSKQARPYQIKKAQKLVCLRCG